MTDSSPSSHPVICCFTMVRNESPILNPFIDQLEEFFDHCVIVDHDSTDGSQEIIRSRNDHGAISLFHLKSTEFPQSDIATFFAKFLIENHSADYIFFLDCDEFLPFKNRDELQKLIKDHWQDNYIFMNRRNICPNALDGGNIFSSGFQHVASSSEDVKIAINARVASDTPNFLISQGYRGVRTGTEDSPPIGPTPIAKLLHIPVQSAVQAALKLSNGHNRTESSPIGKLRKEGAHWVESAKHLAANGGDPDSIRQLALHYPYASSWAPDGTSVSDERTLDFQFPYIRTAYQQTDDYIVAQVYSLLHDDVRPITKRHRFTVTDEEGQWIMSNDHSDGPQQPSDDARANQKTLTLGWDSLSEQFEALIEPLFSIPTKVPTPAASGHAPFLFVLFKILRPSIYVDLGVQHGNSFITACTAAKSLRLPTQLYAAGTWDWDNTTGPYEGEPAYQRLKQHLDDNFSNFHLLRGLFIESRQCFNAGSIDLLNINEHLDYETLKADLSDWFSAMAADGVVVLHNIAASGDGVGIGRLWDEIKAQFCTLEFPHSGGLGVIFLDPDDTRVQPLVELARQDTPRRFYQSLAEKVAVSLEARVGYLTNQRQLTNDQQALQQAQTELADLRGRVSLAEETLRLTHQSISWRMTAPVRVLRRLLGRAH